MKIKRPLLLLTGGFVLGEVTVLQGSMVWGLLFVLLAVIFSIVWKKIDVEGRNLWLWFLPFFVCVGVFRGSWVCDLNEKAIGYGLDGENISAQGEIEDIQIQDKWIVLELVNVKVERQASLITLGRLQVYVEGDGTSQQAYHIGNQVLAMGECSRFSPARNPGEFDYEFYYRAKHMNYRQFADSCRVVEKSVAIYGDKLYQIRRWIVTRLGELAGEKAGMFVAMMIGDKSELDADMRELYQTNGIAHLMAASGLHLSLVSLAVYGLFRRLGGGYGLSGIVGGCALYTYAIVTGASPSVMRALIMVLCGFLAAYLGRTYDLLTAMGVAALYLFWESPYNIYQAGVQLSFGAILGIGAVAPALNEKGNQGFWVSMGLQLTSFPIVLYHFFQYPLYGVFLNLIVIPLMGIVIASGSTGLIFSIISIGLGRFALGSGCGILDLYEGLCGWFSKLPGSSVILGRPEIWQIFVFYVVLVMGLVILNFKNEENGITRWKKCVRVILFASVIVLFPIPTKGLAVTFLDVGQGDGICMQTKAHTVLVDGGSTDQKNLGQYRLEPFLKSQGIHYVDYSIISHGDADHISGIQYLLEEDTGISIGTLILPARGRTDPAYESLTELAVKRGTRVHWMNQGEQLNLGKLIITCIYPRDNETWQSEDRNEHSTVFRVDYGEFTMLLTGDMSSVGEEEILEAGNGKMLEEYLKDVEVLKVAHHGSKYSSCEEWLFAIVPEWAVISCGEDNRYGHPHKEVIERLQKVGSKIITTQESGAIMVWSDGKKMEVKGYVK